MVPVAEREIGEKRNDNAVPAALLVPAMHVHHRRRHVLRQVRSHYTLFEDCEFLNPPLLRQSENDLLFARESLYIKISLYHSLEINVRSRSCSVI